MTTGICGRLPTLRARDQITRHADFINETQTNNIDRLINLIPGIKLLRLYRFLTVRWYRKLIFVLGRLLSRCVWSKMKLSSSESTNRVGFLIGIWLILWKILWGFSRIKWFGYKFEEIHLIRIWFYWKFIRMYNTLYTKQFFFGTRNERVKLILKSFNIFFNFQNNFIRGYFVQ